MNSAALYIAEAAETEIREYSADYDEEFSVTVPYVNVNIDDSTANVLLGTAIVLWATILIITVLMWIKIIKKSRKEDERK